MLFDWSRPEIVLDYGAGHVVCEAFYVAKGRYFAGPWSFAQAARLTEPLLQVVALPRARRRDYLVFLWRLARGLPFKGWRGAIVFECTRLSASGSTPYPVQADGDIIAALPIVMSVTPEPCGFC